MVEAHTQTGEPPTVGENVNSILLVTGDGDSLFSPANPIGSVTRGAHESRIQETRKHSYSLSGPAHARRTRLRRGCGRLPLAS